MIDYFFKFLRTEMVLFAGIFATTQAIAQQFSTVHALTYDEQTKSPVPVPASERMLQTVIAKPWFKPSAESRVLEGAIFDPNGDLLFCDVTGRRVLRVTPDKKLTTIVTLDSLSPGGLALHKDGRLFIAALDLDKEIGAILQVNMDGSGLKPVIGTASGFMPNDLVFDAFGGFYFTDFKGTSTEPKGGVYYTSPDLKTTTKVVANLAMANGIVLTADGKELWITEFGRNLLHRVRLSTSTTIAVLGSAIVYHFTGPCPDSMRVDADGNIYVAIYDHGRVMIFKPSGIPIGQVLLPGRENGHNLQSTSLAIRPGSNDLYTVTSDGKGVEGANIFHAKVFGKGVQYPIR